MSTQRLKNLFVGDQSKPEELPSSVDHPGDDGHEGSEPSRNSFSETEQGLNPKEKTGCLKSCTNCSCWCCGNNADKEDQPEKTETVSLFKSIFCCFSKNDSKKKPAEAKKPGTEPSAQGNKQSANKV